MFVCFIRGRIAWSVTLKDGCRLGVIENRALKRLFGPEGVAVTECWREFWNDELLDFYWSPNVVWAIS